MIYSFVEVSKDLVFYTGAGNELRFIPQVNRWIKDNKIEAHILHEKVNNGRFRVAFDEPTHASLFKLRWGHE